MIKLICTLALLFFGAFAHADDDVATQAPQAINDVTAVVGQPLIDYAKQVAEADGHKNPKLLGGLLKVESSAGEDDGFRVVKQVSGKVVSVFYGVAQLTIGAAKAVMRQFPDLWGSFNTKTDEELKARLILDDKFNVQVASKYLVLLGATVNPEKAIAAYQVVAGAVQHINYRTLPYMRKVKLAAK